MLAVTWPVTPSVRKYKKGASPYVQHFLESEAEGSLIALLKNLGKRVRRLIHAYEIFKCSNIHLIIYSSWFS